MADIANVVPATFNTYVGNVVAPGLNSYVGNLAPTAGFLFPEGARTFQGGGLGAARTPVAQPQPNSGTVIPRGPQVWPI